MIVAKYGGRLVGRRRASRTASTGHRSKPAARRRRSVASGVAKFHGPGQPPRRRRTARCARHDAERLDDVGDVARAAALGDQPAARLQRGVQAGEERVVVGDPVERRGREDRVDRLGELELGEVGHGERRCGRRRARSRASLDHRRRAVDGDHAPARQALEQRRGDAAGAAAGVEHASRRRAARAGRARRGPSPRIGAEMAVVGRWRPSRAAYAARYRHPRGAPSGAAPAYTRGLGAARRDEALGLVGGAGDEVGDLGGALAPGAEHVGGDDLRVGRVRAPDADADAVEVRRRRARA